MSKKGSFIVKMTCTVVKEVAVEDCTEEEARDNPFDFCVDEQEVEMIDFEVDDVVSNE
jgi:hypothetical protein